MDLRCLGQTLLFPVDTHYGRDVTTRTSNLGFDGSILSGCWNKVEPFRRSVTSAPGVASTVCHYETVNKDDRF